MEHSHKRDDEKEHDKEKPIVKEEELEEGKGKYDDGDGKEEKCDHVPCEDQDKKEELNEEEDKECPKCDKSPCECDDKDLSKVPPQLRKHIKGKMKQESIEEIVKENRKLRLRIK